MLKQKKKQQQNNAECCKQLLMKVATKVWIEITMYLEMKRNFNKKNLHRNYAEFKWSLGERKTKVVTFI